jgi:hypothetical protein
MTSPCSISSRTRRTWIGISIFSCRMEFPPIWALFSIPPVERHRYERQKLQSTASESHIDIVILKQKRVDPARLFGYRTSALVPVVQGPQIHAVQSVKTPIAFAIFVLCTKRHPPSPACR